MKTDSCGAYVNSMAFFENIGHLSTINFLRRSALPIKKPAHLRRLCIELRQSLAAALVTLLDQSLGSGREN